MQTSGLNIFEWGTIPPRPAGSEKDSREGYTVILADGDFPSAPVPLAILRNAARIVCCDGAASALLAHGMTPSVITGDLDSLPPELKEKFVGSIIHVEEQDDNDLTKAFRCCMKNGWDNIMILGAAGKREDHTLGNLSLLADYAEETDHIRIITDYGIFFAMKKSGTIRCEKGQQVSIFAMEPGTKVTSSGLKYSMKEYELRRWWQATLNEALSDQFSLTFPEGKTLLIYLAFYGRKKSC